MEPLPELPDANVFYEQDNLIQSEDDDEWISTILEEPSHEISVADVMEPEHNNTSGTILPSSRDVTEGEQNNTTRTILPPSRNVTEGEENSTAFVDLDEEAPIDSNEDGRKIHKKLFNITREQLQQQFGKPLTEAAKALGVSRSTLKRAKDRYGIERWPSHPQNKTNPSLFKASNSIDDSGISKDGTVNFEVHLGHLTECFSFRNLTVNRLVEEVRRTFEVVVEDYIMKYWTEDYRFLSIRDDDDLKACIKNFEEAKTTVVIYLIPKSNKSTPSRNVGSSKRQRVVDQYHRMSNVELSIR